MAEGGAPTVDNALRQVMFKWDDANERMKALDCKIDEYANQLNSSDPNERRAAIFDIMNWARVYNVDRADVAKELKAFHDRAKLTPEENLPHDQECAQRDLDLFDNVRLLIQAATGVAIAPVLPNALAPPTLGQRFKIQVGGPRE